jgi:hypothetical protein
LKYLKKKKKKHLPVLAVVLLDLLLIGAILLTFAFFHHVLPALQSKSAQQQTVATQPVVTEPPATTLAPETTGPVQTEPATEAPVETSAPTEPDNRTEWQKKFADHFTDEVVVTENSYTSPEVSITIETVVTGEGASKITYYVADIYVASLENFKTHTAHGKMTYFDTQPALEMAKEANAILAVSGDFLTYQKSGFLMRNGEIYASDRNYSICVLYPDGTMETHDWGSYQIDDILAKNPIQVWSFGPVLLDENGKVRDSYNVSDAVSFPNPRSAIGYYEPGHYCLVIVDGRQEGHSAGMRIPQLAQVFQDLGCTKAYNLDGGGTAVMLFNGRVYSRQSNGGRDLGDIVLITEAGYGAQEGEE